MPSLKVVKAIGGNTDLLTAQAFVFPGESSTLLLMIAGVGDNTFAKVRQTAFDTQDLFFESNEGAFSKLSTSITYLREQLKEVEELSILAATYTDLPKDLQSEAKNEDLPAPLYIQTSGIHTAVLYRLGKTTTLISPTNLNHSEQVSGYLKPGDRVVFSTSNITDFAKNQLIKTPIVQFEDEIENFIQKNPHTDPIAAILLEFPGGEQIPILASQSETFRPQLKLPSFNLSRFRSVPKTIFQNQKTIGLTLASGAVLAVLIIFLLNLLLSNLSKTKQFNTYLASAKKQSDLAQSLKDTDPSQAADKVNLALKDLNRALKINPNDQAALNLQKQMQQNAKDILKIYSLENWTEYLNLDLLKTGFTTSRWSYSVGNIALLDTSAKSLVQLDLAKKTKQILSGGDQIAGARFASNNGEYTFVYSVDKGVIQVDSTTQKSSNIIKPDPEWGKIDDIVGFGSNVYLLDSAKSQIWKYTPTSSGYSDKIQYFRSDASLQDAKRMLIDASVWVIKPNAEVLRFTAGVPDNFSASGLDKNIEGVSAFFVSDETDNIYLIDQPNSRLVVLKKDGKYQSQYLSDKFKTATDLLVLEKEKKLYILDNNKIYVTDLK